MWLEKQRKDLELSFSFLIQKEKDFNEKSNQLESEMRKVLDSLLYQEQKERKTIKKQHSFNSMKINLKIKKFNFKRLFPFYRKNNKS
jgi:hypothetical protein